MFQFQILMEQVLFGGKIVRLLQNGLKFRFQSLLNVKIDGFHEIDFYMLWIGMPFKEVAVEAEKGRSYQTVLLLAF
jgi:hypothetical protein